MSRLRYATRLGVQMLRRDVSRNLDSYYSGNLWDGNVLGEETRESRLEWVGELALEVGEKPSQSDAVNARTVHATLNQLTPHQASDERLWVYLTHTVCFGYVSSRWLGPRPDDDKKAEQKVLNHYFARGNRAIIRDNGVSRLWWLGKIASEVDPDDPSGFLERLLYRQDVRSALIERPSISMNNFVLRAIYQEMVRSWDDDQALFRRETFRRWMVALNGRGGVVLLDALPSKELQFLVREEAERALAATAEAATASDG